MTTPAEYLDYAKESLEWAEKEPTEEVREACLALARKWTEAALILGGAIKQDEHAGQRLEGPRDGF